MKIDGMRGVELRFFEPYKNTVRKIGRLRNDAGRDFQWIPI